MSLTNPNTPVSQQDLQDFYHKLLPYMGGSGGATYTAGDGIDIDENNVISTEQSESGDMDEIVDDLPNGNIVVVNGFTPVGTIITYFGETAPQHYLVCDGTAYNKADYPELANHLLSLTNNTAYIVDGDNTKFKVPDLRGEFLRGTGTNSHTNQGSGADVGVHQDGTNAPIYGYVSQNSNVGMNAYSRSEANTYVTEADNSYKSGTGTTLIQFSFKSKEAEDVPNVFTSRPTNTSVLYCIATKDIYTNPTDSYSTSEKVVGTWIDGSPIYQKTFTGLSLNFSGQNIAQMSMDTSSINAVIGATVIRINDYPFVDNCSAQKISNSAIELRAHANWENVNNVVLQYTKTID